MEAVNFEKKGLLAQWQASLLGLQRRDEALQACPFHIDTPSTCKTVFAMRSLKASMSLGI